MRLQRMFLAGVTLTATTWLGGPFSLAVANADTPSSYASGAAASAARAVATRVATFTTGAGDHFFAVSLQPNADESLMKQLASLPATISVVIDTSATQVGDYRNDQLAALEGVLSGLRSGDTVQIFAADVSTVAISDRIQAMDTDGIAAAVTKLRRRLPLGNTNLGTALETVRAGLTAGSPNVIRSLIYIGDGASIETQGNEQKIKSLVEQFRSDRVSVHSIAIGPAKNVELLATLANHTGGNVLIVNDEQDNMANLLGKQVAQASTLSPIWIDTIKLPAGLNAVQANRLPPLRLDRDSVLIGTCSENVSGSISITGQSPAGKVSFTTDVTAEASHPDFAFLPGMVNTAKDNDGLMLPSAGSLWLREAARVMAARAEELAKAGSMALKQGNRRGAQAVAELALEADPTNPDAQAVKKMSAGGYRLIMQNQDDPFGGLFDGAGGMPADEPAGAMADDPFGAAGDAFVEPTPPAAPPVAPPAVAPPAAPPVAPPRANPGMLDAAPLDAAPRGNNAFFNDGPLPGDADLLEGPSGLLDDVVQQRLQDAGRLRAEVRAQLRSARRLLDTNPVGVAGSLKSLLNRIDSQPGVDPQIRQELQAQVRSAIQIASRREASFVEAEASAAQVVAAATQTELLLQETFRREERLKTLSNQLNALIDEKRFDEADAEVSVAIAELGGVELAGQSVIGNHMILETQMLNNYVRAIRLRLLRERNFLDAMALVEKSNIPFVDEPPIMYPDAEQWQRLSRRRLERYGSIELTGDNEVERRINSALNDETTQNFVEETLENAIKIIGETHDIPIVVDKKALEEIGLSGDTPVNLSLKNVSLRSFLRLMLKELDLTYMIKDEVMQITTNEAAETNLVNKVYPVGDLVVPVIQLGGGGMGGGMGGGGMGGGGMGGGGMGGGGMGGGGMGGGGMGGGGGMFDVPPVAAIADKTTAGAVAPFAGQPAAPATAAPATATSKPAATADRIRLTPTGGQTSEEAWIAYFEALKLDGAESIAAHDARIRATVSDLNAKALGADNAGDTSKARLAFGEVRDLLAAAILTGNVQPWMYRAYAISLQATGAPKSDIERAYLSAVDFADTPEEVLHVAGQLQQIGCDEAALRLCRHVTIAEPYRREAYVMGMRLAEKLDDVEGLQWACRGILSHAWSSKYEKIENDARLLARATHQRLIDQGDKKAAEAFLADLQSATSHDLVVRVTWTGDADIDISVEEPSGTVCSREEPNSAGGGTFLGDKFPGLEKVEDDGYISETYVCPQGYSGVYRILVRRVWGNVSTGKVTVDILSDVGRDCQRYIRQEIDLTERDALVSVDVQKGSRKTPVGEAQIAHLREVQNGVNQNILGQFAGGNPGALQQYLSDLANIGAAVGRGGTGPIAGNPGGFFPRGAVGFQPELTVLPEGASNTVIAIISADRRYVRISPAPFFSQIGDVSTFNFVSGETGGGGAGGGGGGIGGGGGGGIGGGGGGGIGGGGGAF